MAKQVRQNFEFLLLRPIWFQYGRYLFGKIAMQNETNTYLLEEDILRNLGVNEQSLVGSVLDCLTSFSGLVKVDISRNDFGTHGLGILVKSLGGSPIEDLDLSECGLHGIFPLSGARHCKKLKKLNISGNTLGIDDADTVMMLMDNRHPKLREFSLDRCGITDDFVEKISPALSNNKSLRYLWMFSDDTGTRGVAAVSKAVHDSSSFENTLASNHTIWKIHMKGGAELFHVLLPNFCGHHSFTQGIAWSKYISHFVRTTEIINLQARNDSLKAMAEELGRAQVSVNEENEQLQDEIATLKEQIAILMASNAKPASSKKKIEIFEGSIGERVKKRNYSRKRGKIEIFEGSIGERVKKRNYSRKRGKIEIFEGSIGERVKKRNYSRKRGKIEIFEGSIGERVKKRNYSRKRGRRYNV